METINYMPEFRDKSSRYFQEVSLVSGFDLEPEAEHSFRLLHACMAEHSILMSIPKVRARYHELIVDSLDLNKNLTEISKGCVYLFNGDFHFHPIQSVAPKPLAGVKYGSQLTKDSLLELLAQSMLDVNIYQIGSLSIIDESQPVSSLSLESLLPSEEMRSELYQYACSLSLSKYIKARVFRVHKISEACVKQLTHRNLRLVMSVVKKEVGHLNDLDAIQEGNIGLLKGISRFQPLTGFKLTTYCTWWISKYVKQAKYSHQLIKTPFNLREAYGKVHRYIQKNPHICGSDDDIYLIAEGTGLRVNQVNDVLSKSRSVVYMHELESIETPVQEYDEDKCPDTMIQQVLERLPPGQRQVMSDLLTLSPEERGRFLCPKSKKALKDAISELGLFLE